MSKKDEARASTQVPETYSTTKPDSIPLDRCYVHVGFYHIYIARGDIKRGGGERVRVKEFGPQRDPFERLDWARDCAFVNFKSWLYNEPGLAVEDEHGDYDVTDSGGRCLIGRLLGHPTIEAYVARNLSVSQRAARFYEKAHSRVALGSVADFHALRSKGLKWCHDIADALKPNYAIGNGGFDTIHSVKAVKDVYDAGAVEGQLTGTEVVQKTAQLAANAWKPKFKKVKGGKHGMCIQKGYALDGLTFTILALVRQGMPSHYDETTLRQFLRTHPPKVIMQDTMAELAKAAADMAKHSFSVSLKLTTQHKAVPAAQYIARAVNKNDAKSDNNEHRGVKLILSPAKIADSPLAKKYSGSRQLDDESEEEEETRPARKAAKRRA